MSRAPKGKGIRRVLIASSGGSGRKFWDISDGGSDPKWARPVPTMHGGKMVLNREMSENNQQGGREEISSDLERRGAGLAGGRHRWKRLANNPS